MVWLFKTEPEKYSFAQLLQDQRTGWNGVRNFQARNFLKQVAVGDQVLIYHSGGERAVVGIAVVTRAAYPDPDPQKPGEWVQVDLQPHEPLVRAVSLAELKSEPQLQQLLLIRQSRLSVMPLDAADFQWIVNRGRQKADPKPAAGKTAGAKRQASRLPATRLKKTQ